MHSSAAADAETVHAKNHLRVMGVVGKTADNLKRTIAGETEEFKEMYPKFIEQAKKVEEASPAGVEKADAIAIGLATYKGAQVCQRSLNTSKAWRKSPSKVKWEQLSVYQERKSMETRKID